MTRRGAALAACLLIASAGGAAAEPFAPGDDDPFAGLQRMSDDELLEARGGFEIANAVVDFAGLLIDVTLMAAELDVSQLTFTGPDAPDLSSLADLSRVSPQELETVLNGAEIEPILTLDAGLAQIFLTNSRDNVIISRDFDVNVSITGYETAIATAAASGVVGGALRDTLTAGIGMTFSP